MRGALPCPLVASVATAMALPPSAKTAFVLPHKIHVPNGPFGRNCVCLAKQRAAYHTTQQTAQVDHTSFSIRVR